MTRAVADAVRIPVVASGGAGAPEHLYQVLTEGRADAALAASIFHYNEYGIPATKAYLAERGVPIRFIEPRSRWLPLASVTKPSGVPWQRHPTNASLPHSARREPEANKLFRMVMKHGASDLHLKAGQPPMMRLRGDIVKANSPPLSGRRHGKIAAAHYEAQARKILDEEGGMDFSYVVCNGEEENRFRVSLFKQRGKLSLVARRVNTSIPSFKELGLPPTHREPVQFSRRPGHPRRRHRLRQKHHHRLHARLHRRARAAAHPHDRGSHRVHLHRQEGLLQPARDRPGRHRLAQGASRTRCDKIPMSSSLVSCATSRRSRPPSTPPRPATWSSAPSTLPPLPPPSTVSSICSRPTSTAPSAKALANNLRAVVAQKLLKGLKKPRTPTNEIMIVNPTIRKLIADGEDSNCTTRSRCSTTKAWSISPRTCACSSRTARRTSDRPGVRSRSREAQDGLQGHQGLRAGHSVSGLTTEAQRHRENKEEPEEYSDVGSICAFCPRSSLLSSLCLCVSVINPILSASTRVPARAGACTITRPSFWSCSPFTWPGCGRAGGSMSIAGT